HLQLRVINATTPPLPSTLSLHDALPILHPGHARPTASGAEGNDPGQPAVDHERPPGVAGAGVLAAFRVARAEHAGRHEAEIGLRSEEHTSELQSRENLVCRLLLEKKKKI